jgi:hypothetical protein
MTRYEAEPMPSDEIRREPLPGIDPVEAHRVEADEHTRLAREANARGDIGGSIMHGLAAVRALGRLDGWENVKLEEPELDTKLRDDINRINGIRI